VGDALAKNASLQWVNACEHQRFALLTPSLYAPLLRIKCEDAGRSGLSKVASILKTAAVPAGLGLADSGIKFLSRMERGEGNPRATASERAGIGREITHSVSRALPMLLLRRRPR
jgi:hypothetical protein